MSAAEGVDIDLYADDIEQDFNTDEFAAEGVDLYDDVITTTSGTRRDSEGGDPQSSDRPTTPNNNVTSPISKTNSSSGNTDHYKGDREYIQPLRKHQVYIGNLTWWTSDRDIQESLNDIGVHDFIEVKFYENRANGQSKGYCVLTVGSDSSLKIIKDKFSKKEIHGQVPVVTPPTKQALNQFEAQSKTRPTPGPGGSNNSSGGGGPSGGGGNMNNMMSGPGPRGPMGPQMGYGMNRMGSPIRPPRGMGPPPGHRPSHQGSPGGQGQYNQRMGPPGMQGPGGPHQSNHSGHSMPPGPPQRFPPPFQGGPPRGPHPHGMPPHGMDHQRGPPPRQDWNRPPMNPYPPQGPPGPIPPPMQGPPPPQVRGLPPQGIMTGPPPPAPGAPAPHMNPAFFNPQGPTGPPQGPPPAAYNNSPRPQPGPQYPPVSIEHHETSAMSEAEFEEIMGRNRTVSRSAISRAVTDAASGEFASAIETLVTAISLIKQSKVAQDDRCKILISSLQDTLHGIEAKSYGRRERSRSRERHRRRRDRSRSREREYRDRSRERERYYEYGDRSRERSRSREREREYRERAGGGSAREESGGSSRYYEDRYRERERSERERPQLRPPSERETRSRRSLPEGGPDQERSKYS